jgi:hypothetical protein
MGNWRGYIQGFSGEIWGKETTWKTQALDGRIILKWTCERLDGGAWTGSIWLRIGTGGGLLSIWLWTFGFHKMRGISWVAQDVLASQEGHCSMELVSECV